MRNILIIGAGKSASYLIQYFLDKSSAENLEITLGDLEISNAKNGLEIMQMQKRLNLIYLIRRHASRPFKMQISLFQCYRLGFISKWQKIV